MLSENLTGVHKTILPRYYNSHVINAWNIGIYPVVDRCSTHYRCVTVEDAMMLTCRDKWMREKGDDYGGESTSLGTSTDITTAQITPRAGAQLITGAELITGV